jgi:hypothetical protein
MNSRCIAALSLLCFYFPSPAQELYPLNEPASTLPKRVIGVRVFIKSYREESIYRNLFGARLMYGLTPRLTLMLTASASNHHGRDLPDKLVYHTHNGTQTLYSTGAFQRGSRHPYLFNGLYAYAKYRFLSRDRQNGHFRMAAYAEASGVTSAHDETEPNLMDDTKGFGGGLLVTWLNRRFAASFTGGVIVPGAYNGFSPDSAGPKVPTRIQYGRALVYNLSLGYLLFPRHNSGYRQTNVNLYAELIGRAYEQAKVTQYGYVNVPIQTPLLQAGSYVELHPGVQVIFNSNLRLDVSAGFPVYKKSYAHFYPVFYIALQRYFFPGTGK